MEKEKILAELHEVIEHIEEVLYDVFVDDTIFENEHSLEETVIKDLKNFIRIETIIFEDDSYDISKNKIESAIEFLKSKKEKTEDDLPTEAEELINNLIKILVPMHNSKVSNN